MKDVIIRPATLQDAIAMWGSLSQSIQAYSIFVGGDLVAISGITNGEIGTNFFQDIMPGVNIPKILVWRISKEIVRLVMEKGLTVRVRGGNGRYLLMLGFRIEKIINDTPIYRLDPCHH